MLLNSTVRSSLIHFGFVFLAFQCFGQSYLPFPDSAARWTNVQLVHDDITLELISTLWSYYCMDGQDTLIGAYTYSVINHCGGDYKAAVRDSLGVVYVVPRDSMSEYLLYDFNLQAGDTVYSYSQEFNGVVGWIEERVVSNSWTEQSGGQVVRVVSFSEGDRWIEGVGNDRGFLLNHGNNVSGLNQYLHCFSRQDSTYYPIFSDTPCQMDVGLDESELSEVAVLPNPSDGNFMVERPNANTIEFMDVRNAFGQSVATIQLTGVRTKVSLRLSAGIYILSNPKSGWTQKMVITD